MKKLKIYLISLIIINNVFAFEYPDNCISGEACFDETSSEYEISYITKGDSSTFQEICDDFFGYKVTEGCKLSKSLILVLNKALGEFNTKKDEIYIVRIWSHGFYDVSGEAYDGDGDEVWVSAYVEVLVRIIDTNYFKYITVCILEGIASVDGDEIEYTIHYVTKDKSKVPLAGKEPFEKEIKLSKRQKNTLNTVLKEFNIEKDEIYLVELNSNKWSVPGLFVRITNPKKLEYECFVYDFY